MNPSKTSTKSFLSNLVGFLVDSVQDSLLDALQHTIDEAKSNRESTSSTDTSSGSRSTAPETKTSTKTDPAHASTDPAHASEDSNTYREFKKLFGKINNLNIKLLPENVDFDLVCSTQTDPSTGSEREILICQKYRGSKPDVQIPTGVVVIAQQAFKDDKSVVTVSLPDTVEIIESGAFENCQNLSEITFSPNLTTIGAYAFAECSSLKTLEIPDSVISLGAGIFKGCVSLEHIVLPGSLAEIPDAAFESCISLKTIRWPVRMPVIGKDVFRYAFSNMLWEYFELEHGVCTRIRGDIQALPSAAIQLMFEESSFERQTVTNLLLWASNITPLQSDKIALRLMIISETFELAAILTSADNYAFLELVDDLFDLLFHNLDKSMEDLQTCIMAAFILTLMSISQTGRSYLTMDNRLFESLRSYYHMEDETHIPLVFCPEDLQERILAAIPETTVKSTELGKVIVVPPENPDKAEVMLALRKSLLSEIGVEITAARYNPEIIHYIATLFVQDDYWTFVSNMEGLLRGLDINPDKYEVPYAPEIEWHDWNRDDDALAFYCQQWSQVLWEDELIVLVFRPNEDLSSIIPWRIPDLASRRFLALVTEQQAQNVISLLNQYKCRSMVDAYQNGEKMVSLQFV